MDLAEVSHNDRELDLMLQGKKPLSMFYAPTSELPDEDLIPENAFKPHMQNRRIVRSETIIKGPKSPLTNEALDIKYVMFALKDEAWRLEAMLLLVEQHSKTEKWNETCERMECFLLGYSEEETDAWCEKRFQDAP